MIMNILLIVSLLHVNNTYLGYDLFIVEAKWLRFARLVKVGLILPNTTLNDVYFDLIYICLNFRETYILGKHTTECLHLKNYIAKSMSKY